MQRLASGVEVYQLWQDVRKSHGLAVKLLDLTAFFIAILILPLAERDDLNNGYDPEVRIANRDMHDPASRRGLGIGYPAAVFSMVFYLSDMRCALECH